MRKRALRFLLNDYSSDYETLKKNNKCTMEIKRVRLLPLEIFKVTNENCPSSLSTISKNENLVLKKWNSKISIQNSITFGDNSLRTTAPHVRNSPYKQLKTETSYIKIKEEIDKRFSPKCKCSLCSYIKSV